MATDDPGDPRICMRRSALRCAPLPYIPTLFPGELLSSWLKRIGAEFGVSLQTLAHHFNLSKMTAACIDQDLSSDDIHRLAAAMRSEPAEIRLAMHHRLQPEVRALRATPMPIQAKPVRLVTARTILLAAMARFSDDAPAALSLIRGAGGSAIHSVERWFSGLPSHSQEFLSASCETDRPELSKNCSTSWKRNEGFPGLSAARCDTKTNSDG